MKGTIYVLHSANFQFYFEIRVSPQKKNFLDRTCRGHWASREALRVSGGSDTEGGRDVPSRFFWARAALNT